MKFSLIIPTIHRKKQMNALLRSIQSINYQDYEVIIVDQNQDGLIDDICAQYDERFRHLKVNFVGASRARNFGFQYATGDVVLFPDDDSEVTVNLLNDAKCFFSRNVVDFLFGRVKDKQENSDVLFENKERIVTFKNMFHTTSECTMFVKREIYQEVGGFDEFMGVGTFYGADEGADLFLRAMYGKYTLRYSPALVFYHPQKVKNNFLAEVHRGYSYGKGFGRLVFKHVMKYKNYRMITLFLYFQLRATGGCVLGMVKLNHGQIQYYKELIKGRWVGLFCSIMDYLSGKKI